MISRANAKTTSLTATQLVKNLCHRRTFTELHRCCEGTQYDAVCGQSANPFPAVQEALELIRHATQDIFSPLQSGVLTLQVNTAFLMLWLAPRLHEFTALYPDITLRLINVNWENESTGMSTDLTIIQGGNKWPNGHCHLLMTPALRPFCSPEMSEKLQRPEDLFNMPLIDVLGNHQNWDDWFKAAGMSQHPTILHQVDTAATAVLMAEHHAGICLSYDALVSDALSKGRLVPPFATYIETVDTYYLVANSNRPLSKAAQVFQEWLLLQSQAIDL